MSDDKLLMGHATPLPAGMSHQPLNTLTVTFQGDLQRLRVEPGDVFVLSVKEALDEDTANQLRDSLSKALAGAPVIVLTDDLKLGVVKFLNRPFNVLTSEKPLTETEIKDIRDAWQGERK